MPVEYIGEHLLPGQIGNILIALSFVSALCSAAAYFMISRQSELDTEGIGWKKIARSSFAVHALSVIGIIAVMFYLILNHRYEYQYVWQHSNNEMPFKYMLSCFWEGQEGSFLLWTMWHIILAFFLIRYSGKWEFPVMTIVALVQVFLASMILGVFVGDYKLGSNPFLLLREHPDYANLPFVKVPNYLENLDGRGLNPLLQNYWMTIHPPTLFLGFALTLIPFAYSLAGLWTKQFHEWIKPALSWTFAGIMILGVGILMGGAWAYESLSFGGFWAWDPVENASLVPWLTLASAGHMMLLHRSRRKHLLSTHIFTILTFLLILYSTFLTRSGILGDTSVHAFTDLGMSGQLVFYMVFFVLISAALIITYYKQLKTSSEEEDHLSSREFWMFIGCLILIIAAFQITFTTSIPVINKLFGTNLAPPLKPVQHYNSWQIPFAVIVSLVMGLSQYLKYKKSDWSTIKFKLLFPALASLVITVILTWMLKMSNYFYPALCFASLFAILTNLSYFVDVFKGKITKAGSSIAHVGFAMILLGSLISAGNSKIISQNTSGTDVSQLGKDFKNNENIMLVKGDSLRMGEYLVTYKGRHKDGINIKYTIDYLKQDEKGAYVYDFTLEPLVQTNPRMGNIAEPDTRHFLCRDIYTHITYAEVEDKPQGERNKSTQELASGDTAFINNYFVILNGLTKDLDRAKLGLHDSDIAIGADIIVKDIYKNEYRALPVYRIKENYIDPIAAEVPEAGIKFIFSELDVNTGKIKLEIDAPAQQQNEFIIMKAMIFPGINILWIGCLLMAIGTGIAIKNRKKEKQSNASSN